MRAREFFILLSLFCYRGSHPAPSPPARRLTANGRRPLNPRDTAARFVRKLKEYGARELPTSKNSYAQALNSRSASQVSPYRPRLPRAYRHTLLYLEGATLPQHRQLHRETQASAHSTGNKVDSIATNAIESYADVNSPSLPSLLRCAFLFSDPTQPLASTNPINSRFGGTQRRANGLPRLV